MSAQVLVTGSGTGATENLVRSLRAGEPALVVVGCHDDPFLLKKSTADRKFLVSKRTDARFVESLDRIVEQEKIDLVIPTTDPDVRVIGGARDRLRCRTFLPGQPVIELCQDKYVLTTFLRVRGIPAPETCAVTDLESVDGLVARLARGAGCGAGSAPGRGRAGRLPSRARHRHGPG